MFTTDVHKKEEMTVTSKTMNMLEKREGKKQHKHTYARQKGKI